MSGGMDDQAITAGRIDRIRVASLGIMVDGVSERRLQEILEGGRPPTSLELALIATASGHTVDWLLHGVERTSTPVACRANEYNLNDTYNGRTLCGCDNCREYVAERESEDEV